LKAIPRRQGRDASRESASCGALRLCLHRAICLSSRAGLQNRQFGLLSRENVTSAS
jgi:hypothetical protein